MALAFHPHHHSVGAKNKKILTSISELVGSPFKPVEGIVECFTLTGHSESSQKKNFSTYFWQPHDFINLLPRLLRLFLSAKWMEVLLVLLFDSVTPKKVIEHLKVWISTLYLSLHYLHLPIFCKTHLPEKCWNLTSFQVNQNHISGVRRTLLPTTLVFGHRWSSKAHTASWEDLLKASKQTKGKLVHSHGMSWIGKNQLVSWPWVVQVYLSLHKKQMQDAELCVDFEIKRASFDLNFQYLTMIW